VLVDGDYLRHRPTRLRCGSLRLYLVTDPYCLQGRTLTDVVSRAIAQGVTCVQLRDKDASTRDFFAMGQTMMTLLAGRDIALLINDRVDVALALGAHGVHLGQRDLPVAAARNLLPPEVCIGWSVECLQDVQRSATLDLDYLGVSPIFATPTKSDAGQPWGVEGLRTVRSMTTLPLVAIGGVNKDNASLLLDAGADGLAVVSAICAAIDPGAATRELREICDAH
jgi:thiamine-phosphate pyrophosphorylase